MNLPSHLSHEGTLWCIYLCTNPIFRIDNMIGLTTAPQNKARWLIYARALEEYLLLKIKRHSAEFIYVR